MLSIGGCLIDLVRGYPTGVSLVDTLQPSIALKISPFEHSLRIQYRIFLPVLSFGAFEHLLGQLGCSEPLKIKKIHETSSAFEFSGLEEGHHYHGGENPVFLQNMTITSNFRAILHESE